MNADELSRLAGYLHSAIEAGRATKDDWRDWADRMIEAAVTPDWIIDLSLARSKEQAIRQLIPLGPFDNSLILYRHFDSDAALGHLSIRYLHFQLPFREFLSEARRLTYDSCSGGFEFSDLFDRLDEGTPEATIFAARPSPRSSGRRGGAAVEGTVPGELNAMSDAAVSLLGRPLESVFDSFASVGFGQRTTLELVLDRVCLKVPDFGIALAGSPAGEVTVVLLYAVEADGYRPFFGDLPEGLRAGESQAVVRKRLGAPDDFGGGIVPGDRYEVPLWDRWARGS